MAEVSINRGTIEATDLLSDVPEDGWRTLLGARRSFVKTHLPDDCRELLRFVEDGERMCGALGYSDVADFIRRGLEIDPELVEWAISGLRALKPDEPITFEAAVALGRHGGARRGAGYPEGRPNGVNESSEHVDNQPCEPKVDYGSAEYWRLRAKRDRPDLFERIANGDITPNRAAVDAGWLRPRNPVTSALAWVRKMTAEELYDFESRFDEYLQTRRAAP